MKLGTTSFVWSAVGLLSAIGGATPALADPRLDERVYSPYVQNHVVEVELPRGQELGGPLDGARTDVVELEYGLNDRVSLALVGNIEREADASSHLNGLGLEGVVYLGQIPHLGVDVGLYVEYIAGLNGEDDAAEVKLLLAKNADRFRGLFNLIVEHPIGAPAGESYSSYGYAVSATWRTIGALRLGVEAFGDLGDDHGFLNHAQGAYVGSQLLWETRPSWSPVEIEIDAGWLTAVGPDRDEARSQARLTVELERHF